MLADSAAHVRQRLQSLVDIRPGEGARVAVLFLYSVASVGGVLTIGPAATDALFMSELSASALPYMFILPAISTILALLIYNRVAARLRLDQAILGSNVLLIAVMVLFRLLLGTAAGTSFALLAALFMFMEFAGTLIALQFWSIAGQIFNAREAKRLFGLIAAGGTLAAPAAGFSLVGLVRLIGVANLLWVVALAQLICLCCAAQLGRWQGRASPAPGSPPDQPAAGQLMHELRAIGRSPLLRAIGALTIALTLLINIATYQFYQAVQALFAGRGDDMAAYLGAFELWAGLAAVVVQVALTGRILHRFGVFVAMLFFPLSMALGAGLSVALGGAFWALTLLRAADPVFHGTVNTAALNVLYLPLPASVRERAKELFEGLAAATFGVAGVVFLILQYTPGWDDRYYSIPLLALVAVWLLLLGGARRQYTRALVDSLKRRVLDLAGTIDITDETTARLLASALRDRDDLHVLHTLQLIAAAAPANWDADVVALLGHPAAAIRLQAIRHLGRPGNLAYLAAVAQSLDAPDADVRAAAIAAYCAMAGQAASQQIEPYLAAADPSVKAAAAAGLIQHGAGDAARRALAELDHMLASGDPAARLAGTRAIGLVRSPALAGHLAARFADASREVRTSAIQAAGELGSPELAAYLIRALGSKASAPAAAQALAKYPSGIEPELGAALADPLIGGSIPRILERLGTRPAVDLLLAHFGAPGDATRGEVYRALARLRSSQVAFDLPAPAVRDALFAEIRQGYAWAVLRAGAGAAAADRLLDDALRVRLSQAFDRIFALLIMLLSPEHIPQIRRVRQALDTAPTTTRALAIELLDNLTERRVKDLLLPLIEAPAERQLEIAQRLLSIERPAVPDQLRALASGPDRWLRACALAELGALRSADLAAPALAALAADDDLLRETALSVCGALVGAEQFIALAAARAADSSFPIARRYAQARLSALATPAAERLPAAPPQAAPNGGPMPLSTIERVLLLKGAELFHHIAGEELVPLALIAQEVSFPAGTTLIRQGEPGDCLYIIVAGEASINIRGVGAVARRSVGGSVGEMALLSRQPRSADCVAITELAALRIERDDFWEVLAEMPALALGVIETLSQRLEEAVANLQRASPHAQPVPAERDRDGLE